MEEKVQLFQKSTAKMREEGKKARHKLFLVITMLGHAYFQVQVQSTLVKGTKSESLFSFLGLILLQDDAVR